MTLVECKPIGVLNMIDNDSCDEKIIAVPVNDLTIAVTMTLLTFLVTILTKFSTFSRYIRALKAVRLHL